MPRHITRTSAATGILDMAARDSKMLCSSDLSLSLDQFLLVYWLLSLHELLPETLVIPKLYHFLTYLRRR